MKYLRTTTFLLVTCLITSTAQSQEFRHLVFANGYRTIDAAGLVNDYVALGHYDFLPEGRVKFVAFVYDARKDYPPNATRLRHPLMLQLPQQLLPGPIHIPRYVSEEIVTGTYAFENRVLRIQLGSVLHQWHLHEEEPGFFTMRKPYINVQDGSHVIDGRAFSQVVGVAYLAPKVGLPRPLSRADLLNDYDGEILNLQQPVAGQQREWKRQATQLHTRWYRSYDQGNVLGYVEVNPQNHPPMAYFSTLLLNYAPHSNLILYHDGGHDFNRNGVYDEFGHNIQMFGVVDRADRVDRIIFIESSFQLNGIPIQSVGRYFPHREPMQIAQPTSSGIFSDGNRMIAPGYRPYTWPREGAR